MCQLIETIRLLDGKFYNLPYHTARMTRAWKEIFHLNYQWSLSDVLKEQIVPKSGFFKCRIIYDTKFQGIAFEPYQMRNVVSLKMTHNNTISYAHKFKDRTVLENQFAERGNCDDVLIIRNGLVTDTSYANILFKRNNEWFTPELCLLPGTMRQQLIDQKRVRIESISAEQIRLFEKFKLINSMMLDEGEEVEVSNIIE
jgi:4-amino-4-deoxychorismate lyase